MSRVIHTGQALVDVVVEVSALPVRGQNVMAASATDFAGGAVNVLIAAARAGAACVHAGAIGTGPRGDLIRAGLAAAGIGVSAVPVPDLDTGICLVLVEPSAERTFVTTLGAERRLSVTGLDASVPQPGDLICVTGYSLVLPHTAEPLLVWLETLPDGVDVVLDPGAAFAALPPELRDDMLRRTTVWTSNAEEADAFLRAIGRQAEPTMEALAAALHQVLGAAVIVVRDGPKGCAVRSADVAAVVPGFPQRPVDTNGAGDAHTGALVAERAQGTDWIQACRRANATAAIKVTRKGPATAPTRAEVDAFLADQGPH